MGSTCSSGFPTGEPGVELPPPPKLHTDALGTGNLGYYCPARQAGTCAWSVDVESHKEGREKTAEHIQFCVAYKEMKANPFGVKVGQVWKDNDPRTGNRQVKVVAVELDEKPAHAIVQRGNRKTRIRLDRFNEKRTTGYTLVQDHPLFQES